MIKLHGQKLHSLTRHTDTVIGTYANSKIERKISNTCSGTFPMTLLVLGSSKVFLQVKYYRISITVPLSVTAPLTLHRNLPLQTFRISQIPQFTFKGVIFCEIFLSVANARTYSVYTNCSTFFPSANIAETAWDVNFEISHGLQQCISSFLNTLSLCKSICNNSVQLPQ